jgi:hypothetical protein
MHPTRIRQYLHDYIDSANDKKLKAICTLLERDIIENQLIKNRASYYGETNLTEEQILMLQLSDNDIAAGKLISQAQMDKNDWEFLNQ